jgi:hypothetical protein
MMITGNTQGKVVLFLKSGILNVSFLGRIGCIQQKAGGKAVIIR